MIHLFLGINELRLYRDQFTDCNFLLFEFPVIRIVSLINNIDQWCNLTNLATPVNQYWQVYEGSFRIKTPAVNPNEMPTLRVGEYQLMLYKFASYQGNPNLVAAPNWLLYTPAVVTSAYYRTAPAPII